MTATATYPLVGMGCLPGVTVSQEALLEAVSIVKLVGLRKTAHLFPLWVLALNGFERESSWIHSEGQAFNRRPEVNDGNKGKDQQESSCG